MLNSGYCRLCGEIKIHSNLSVIKNEDEYSKNLCNQILQCFQIQISADDNLPKTICLDCRTQTNVTYEFFNKVRRAQEFLRNVCDPLLSYTTIAFTQPVVGIISNENNTDTDDLIKRFKSDTGAEQDAQQSDSDELWDYESSTDSTTFQSSSTSKILDKNIAKIEKQSKNVEVAEIEIKDEFNSNEISGLQRSDDANEMQSTEKDKVTRKRKRSKKKIGESKQKICKDEGNQEICEELEDYTWSCNVCSDKLVTRQHLIEHFQQKHNKPVEYSCLDCPRTLSIYAVFVQHVQRHRNRPTFCCDECGKIFKEKLYLRRHVDYVHGPGRFKCNICDKVYKNPMGLKHHQKFHLPTDPNPVMYPCEICHKKFLTKKSVIKHEKLHDESNKHFTCEKCGTRFRAQKSLELHIENIHTVYNEDQYIQCPLCPTKLKHMRQLTRHKRLVHFPTKLYECETCDKKFSLLHRYKIHRMIHTGERPCKCEHCDKSFRIKAHLKVHMRQHTGEKPYCCSDCKHHFTDFANYSKHMKSKHGITDLKKLRKIAEGKTVS